MKKCSYCGRDNQDEALNCRECGTEFEQSVDAPVPEEPTQPESLLSEYSAELSGVLKTVASLATDKAIELLVRLNKEGIAVQTKTFTAEGELEYADIMVEDANFDRACDVAEAWQAEQLAAAERRSNKFCPRCGSKHLEYIGETQGRSAWICKDCGNTFSK